MLLLIQCCTKVCYCLYNAVLRDHIAYTMLYCYCLYNAVLRDHVIALYNAVLRDHVIAYTMLY